MGWTWWPWDRYGHGMVVAMVGTWPREGQGHGMAVVAMGWPWWPWEGRGHERAVSVGQAVTVAPPLLPPAPGGQFKREVLVDGQSHLLLIREEGGAPDAKVSGGRGKGVRSGAVPAGAEP